MEPKLIGLDGERLYDQAACALVLTDKNGLILRCNDTFCGWVGWPNAELVGKRRVQDMFTIGSKVFHQTHLLPLLQMQGSVAEVQIDLRHADQSALPTLINIFRREHAGETVDELAIFLATDRRSYERELLTERRNVEASLLALGETQRALEENQRTLALANSELARADRQKDQFLATLAHELRNPLAPMQNVVAILKLKSLEDPQLIWARDVLERQMAQMSHLVDDLLDVSRITQGKVELRRTTIEIARAMHRAVEASAPLIAAKGHQLHLTLPDEPLFVSADTTRLTQILTNLLNNAAKYTPNGGEIWFEAAKEGEQVAIFVRDNGIGIADDELDQVFTMFSQLEPAREKSRGGLGIGLALVKALVALHHGTIAVSSPGRGKGSTFVVRVPLLKKSGSDTQADVQANVHRAVPAPSVPERRILVVDDNRDSADMLKTALSMLGYSVEQYYDGANALTAAALFLPDVVILDIGLPDMDGYELARELRRQEWAANCLLIAATGFGQRRDQEKALAAGCDVHMVKPLDFAHLISAINLGRTGR